MLFKKIKTKINIVRYGNVLFSRGSVIPLFIEKIFDNQKLPITSFEMTRFILSLEESFSLVLLALEKGSTGDVFIKKLPATSIETLIKTLEIIFKKIKTDEIGIRQGEKLHEELISEEEMKSTIEFSNHFIIKNSLNNDLDFKQFFIHGKKQKFLDGYNSQNTNQLNQSDLYKILIKQNFIKEKVDKFFQNKTILILGGRGFLGFHIRAYLNYKLNLKNIIVLNKEDLKKDKLNYKNKIIKSDIIFNASGTNRSKIKGQIIKDHKDFVKVVLLALKKKKETLFINLSSKQQSKKSEYGKSKKYVIDKLIDFSKSNSLITVKNIILPNLFGEFSKPNYNSVVSTFCYNLIKNKKSNILNKNIELMYVGDAIKYFIEKLNKKEIRVKGKIFSVKKIYNILEKQNFDYKKAIVLKFNNFFEKTYF